MLIFNIFEVFKNSLIISCYGFYSHNQQGQVLSFSSFIQTIYYTILYI